MEIKKGDKICALCMKKANEPIYITKYTSNGFVWNLNDFICKDKCEGNLKKMEKDKRKYCEKCLLKKYNFINTTNIKKVGNKYLCKDHRDFKGV